MPRATLSTRLHAICHIPQLTDPKQFISTTQKTSYKQKKLTQRCKEQAEPPFRWSKPSRRKIKHGLLSKPPAYHILCTRRRQPNCRVEFGRIRCFARRQFMVCTNASTVSAVTHASLTQLLQVLQSLVYFSSQLGPFRKLILGTRLQQLLLGSQYILFELSLSLNSRSLE